MVTFGVHAPQKPAKLNNYGKFFIKHVKVKMANPILYVPTGNCEVFHAPCSSCKSL
jgi:hypothetical protein